MGVEADIARLETNQDNMKEYIHELKTSQEKGFDKIEKRMIAEIKALGEDLEKNYSRKGELRAINLKLNFIFGVLGVVGGLFFGIIKYIGTEFFTSLF